MKRKKKQSFIEGAVVRIAYEKESHTYAQLVAEPWVCVFDAAGSEGAEGAVSRPVLFKVAVHTYGIIEGRWPIVAHVLPRPEERQIPDTFIQDAFEPSKLRIVSVTPEGEWSERSASIAECERLEPALVWDPEHVEERIRDHYAGRVNLSMLSTQIVRSGQVFTMMLLRGDDAAGNWVVSGQAHAPIHVGMQVIVDPKSGSHLVVNAVKTYGGDSDIPTLVAGQSGTLHLGGEVTQEHRVARRALFAAR